MELKVRKEMNGYMYDTEKSEYVASNFDHRGCDETLYKAPNGVFFMVCHGDFSPYFAMCNDNDLAWAIEEHKNYEDYEEDDGDCLVGVLTVDDLDYDYDEEGNLIDLGAEAFVEENGDVEDYENYFEVEEG